MYQTPKLLAQLGVEGFQERLIEVGHSLACVEAVEEGRAVDTVQGRRRPVQQLDQSQGLKLRGRGQLLEEGAQDGRSQVPYGVVPVEWAGGRRRLARPQHPCGEDAVEEGLHQGGAKEGRSPLALETHSQRLLKGGADGMEGWRVARSLHPRQPVPRVGRQEPRQVLGFDNRRAVGQRPAQVLTQTGAHVAGKCPRRLQPGVKFLLRLGKTEGLQLNSVALGVLSHQHEVPGVGDQHEPVKTPVAAHLVAVRRQPCVVTGGLDLHDAALGDLPGTGLSLLHLPSRI